MSSPENPEKGSSIRKSAVVTGYFTHGSHASVHKQSKYSKTHDILAVCATCSGDAAALTLAAVAIFSCCPAIQQQAGIHRQTVCSWLDIPQIIESADTQAIAAQKAVLAPPVASSLKKKHVHQQGTYTRTLHGTAGLPLADFGGDRSQTKSRPLGVCCILHIQHCGLLSIAQTLGHVHGTPSERTTPGNFRFGAARAQNPSLWCLPSAKLHTATAGIVYKPV